MLVIEPTGDLALAHDGVRLLGMTATRSGRWPVLRHVFDIEADAGLHVDLDPLGFITPYAVGYNYDCEELLTPL